MLETTSGTKKSLKLIGKLEFSSIFPGFFLNLTYYVIETPFFLPFNFHLNNFSKNPAKTLKFQRNFNFLQYFILLIKFSTLFNRKNLKNLTKNCKNKMSKSFSLLEIKMSASQYRYALNYVA